MRYPEASPLTVSTCSNACLGEEVQRKAALIRTFCNDRAILDVRGYLSILKTWSDVFQLKMGQQTCIL